jgi:hypothetical protein
VEISHPLSTVQGIPSLGFRTCHNGLSRLKWCDSGVWRFLADGTLLPSFELCFTTGSGQLAPLAESDIDALHRHDLPHNRGGLVTHHSSKYDVEGKLCLATQSDRPWTRICLHSAGTAFRPHRQKSLSKENIGCWRLNVLKILVSKCNPKPVGANVTDTRLLLEAAH